MKDAAKIKVKIVYDYAGISISHLNELINRARAREWKISVKELDELHHIRFRLIELKEKLSLLFPYSGAVGK